MDILAIDEAAADAAVKYVGNGLMRPGRVRGQAVTQRIDTPFSHAWTTTPAGFGPIDPNRTADVPLSGRCIRMVTAGDGTAKTGVE
jgi:hypothetical protein